MLPILLNEDHREKAGTGPAAGNDVEGRRRLRDALAIPASELLADVLDHLPGAGDDLEGLGDVFAELRKPRPAAAGAGGRALMHHPLARQVLGEWLARGTLTVKAGDMSGP